LSKHSKTPLYACSYCNQGFSTRSTAKSHVENSHVMYLCPVCNKSFKNKSHCVRHISSTHNGTNNNDINNNDINAFKPKREIKVEAKIIDCSSANINMLNGIPIEKFNDNKTSNELNSSNLLVYDSNNQFYNNNNTANNVNNTDNKFGDILVPIYNNDSNTIINNNNNSSNNLNTFFTNQQSDNKMNTIAILTPNIKYFQNDNKNQQFFNINNTINTSYSLKQNSNSNNNSNIHMSVDNLRYQI
jgi:hypothetical protein